MWYWRNFDVADGSQAFNLSPAPLLKTHVKNTSNAKKNDVKKKQNTSTCKLAISVYIMLIIKD